MHPHLVHITSKVTALARAGHIACARKLFDEMPQRDSIAWNAMLTGYSHLGLYHDALSLFHQMRITNTRPDHFSFTSALSACAGASELRCGKKIHVLVFILGYNKSLPVNNALIDMYGKCLNPHAASGVFEEMGLRNDVSWCSLLFAYVNANEFGSAQSVIDAMPRRVGIAWNTMIAGRGRFGEIEACFDLFKKMIKGSYAPDQWTFSALMNACTESIEFWHGKMFHSCAIRYGFHVYAYVGNGLVNMYAKCGDIEGSNQAFKDILGKDLVSWNTMLLAFGLHGFAHQALQVHKEIMASGLKPDKVTLIGLLMTCSHSGLIKKGWSFFESMSSVYGISPEVDHVACMVNMLARGGYLEEAREVANKNMGIDGVKISSYEALFGACSAHGDLDMGAMFGEKLKILEPRNEMSYVVLSNLYCTSGQWKEAEMVRKAMADHGVWKTPGCSWIEVRNRTTAFVAGKHSHLHMEELYSLLQFLDYEMKNPCSVICDDGIT
ncbi:hypothetical protein LguiA_031157 [Lonicera macranthoides]